MQPRSPRGCTLAPVAVKITDMLGEEVVVVLERSGDAQAA
jgi:hypothetical protein